MKTNTMKNMAATLVLPALLGTFSNTAMAEAYLPVLNQNFESDRLPIPSNRTLAISGWADVGNNDSGAYAPEKGVHYLEYGNHGQVAYLEGGGAIRQGLSAPLVLGETYTLTFDIGRPLKQNFLFTSATLMANSYTLAQTAVNHNQVKEGEWGSFSISFTADEHMPIGSPIVVEFQNLYYVDGSQADVDNVMLKTSGDASPLSLKNILLIEDSTTLSVPEDYADINEALDFLSDKFIANDAIVTVQVTDCTNQVYTSPIEIKHPNAKQIEIIGIPSNPASCVLQFNGSSGFDVASKTKLKLLNGFHIKGNRVNTTHGVGATKGGSIRLGASTIISGFYHGVEATLNGRIYANTVLISGNAGSGVVSQFNGYVQANGAQSKDNDLHGFYSADGGIIEANTSKAINNMINGYFSQAFGHIQSQEAEARGNQDSGFFATGKSFIDANSSTSINNDIGYQCDYNGYVKRQDSTETGGTTSHIPAVDRYKNNCYMF